MTCEAIQAALQVHASAGVTGAAAGMAPTPPAPCDGTGEFGQLVSKGIAEVNHQLMTSQADLQHLATGNVQNLHQVMIRLEESRLSFQLLLQVRNRLLEAYQDVLKMQV